MINSQEPGSGQRHAVGKSRCRDEADLAKGLDSHGCSAGLGPTAASAPLAPARSAPVFIKDSMGAGSGEGAEVGRAGLTILTKGSTTRSFVGDDLLICPLGRSSNRALHLMGATGGWPTADSGPVAAGGMSTRSTGYSMPRSKHCP